MGYSKENVKVHHEGREPFRALCGRQRSIMTKDVSKVDCRQCRDRLELAEFRRIRDESIGVYYSGGMRLHWNDFQMVGR